MPVAGWMCVVLPLALVCAFPLQRASSASRDASPQSPQAVDHPIVIVTAAPVYVSLAALHGEERFPQGAQLMLLRAGHLEPFIPGFAASADASVSFDAKTVLFAGKKNPGDRWQIWEVPIDSGTPQLVLAASTDLIRPLWMPDDRIVYARRTPAGFALEASGLNGAGVAKLSFLPGNFIPDDVLRDGRVLFESGFPLSAGGTPELYLVYADGSGVESVRCDHGAAREHGRQMSSGDVVFTHGQRLGRFTSALAEETPVAVPGGIFAGDVAETPDGRWLLAMRRPGEKKVTLTVWNPGSRSVTTLARAEGRDLVEPVVVAPRPVPNRHPSALHDWTTGNLLALDARQSRSGLLPTAPTLVRAETLDEQGHTVVLGTAPVEKDGSFFVQASGDRPLRFILLNAAGHTVREEHGWFWIRQGEQRICVGCHTGPERAPDNRVPEVLLRTTTPVPLTGRDVLTAMGGH